MDDAPAVRYAVTFSSVSIIDRLGIVCAVRRALFRAVRSFNVNPEETMVLLDGGLRAPREFPLQKTIIRGDEQVPLIAMASIAAKVKRDARMRNLSRRYPVYRFEEHKGYGTDLHMRLLRRHGPCEIHRKSFLQYLPARIPRRMRGGDGLRLVNIEPRTNPRASASGE